MNEQTHQGKIQTEKARFESQLPIFIRRVTLINSFLTLKKKKKKAKPNRILIQLLNEGAIGRAVAMTEAASQ